MRLFCTAAVLSAAATVSFAAGLPARGVSGNYMEARTADVYTGPCFANGEVEINGKEAVFGWKINKGSWKGVDFDTQTFTASPSRVQTSAKSQITASWSPAFLKSRVLRPYRPQKERR